VTKKQKKHIIKKNKLKTIKRKFGPSPKSIETVHTQQPEYWRKGFKGLLVFPYAQTDLQR